MTDEKSSYHHVPAYNGNTLEEFSRMSDVWIKHIFANPQHERFLVNLLMHFLRNISRPV